MSNSPCTQTKTSHRCRGQGRTGGVRREEAIAQVTGLRVLSAIADANPVRPMKRDLLFVVERLSAILDDRRLAITLRGCD